MATVTIRGSIMPSAHLPRGEVVTVQRTPQIDSLIRQGFVDVIEEHPDTPEPEGKIVSPESPAPESELDTPLVGIRPAPAKNASREDWADFIGSLGIVTADLTRDQLIGAWEHYQDERSKS